LRLWPIGWALAACFAATTTGLAGLTWLALALLHRPKLPHSPTVSLHDFIGVLQLVFASVAGTGALVALVMTYRRQRVAETTTAHDRSRVLNERFTTIAAQLGDDQAAVRLAGVHAMAGLADDWEENRQTCIDVLCAYLRMPYEPEPGDDAPAQERLAFRSGREVRHTVIRVITAHLRDNAPVSWQGLDFDFTGVVFDGGDFSGARFSGGTVTFFGAGFSSEEEVVFDKAEFSGGTVSFDAAEFSAGAVTFFGAVFSGCDVSFAAKFSGGQVIFNDAVFSGGTVSFELGRFSGGSVNFGTEFSGAEVSFDLAEVSGGVVSLAGAGFIGGDVNFGAQFSGGEVDFEEAEFSGASVSFADASFLGGSVDFSLVADWSHPPTFSWVGTPPAGVKLPTAAPGSEAE
jgi:uncharacterized protein YjbI with pentapeptide repeats